MLDEKIGHTPGPWKAVLPDFIDFRHPLVMTEDGSSRVAFMADGGPAWAVDAPTERANARLIAAAPDLLEAIQDIARNFDHREDAHRHGNPGACQRCIAEAAIAKATGQS